VNKDDPWLDIPAAEYEAHMRAVGQAEVLREMFARVVIETRPARVLVLGCTTGADLALLDPGATELAVGVDLNPHYIEVAAARLRKLGERLRLVSGDVMTADLPRGPYDLVHAALLLEYVDPDVMFARAHGWLAPAGTLSIVTQEPAPDLPAVGETEFESLRELAGRMTLRAADEVATLAEGAGFALAARRTVKLPSGKKLVGSLFDKARPSLDRGPRRGRC
jgi:SAM-dependent methyltransferase